MTHFKPTIAALLFGLFATFSYAQNTPVGLWQSYSDKDGLPQAQIQISEKNGHYFGRIAKVVDITAKPGDSFDASIKADLGNYQTWNIGGHISGPLGEGIAARVVEGWCGLAIGRSCHDRRVLA